MEGLERLTGPKLRNPTHWPACFGARLWGSAAEPRRPGAHQSEVRKAGPPRSQPESGGVCRQRPPSSQSHRALVGALLMPFGAWLAACLSLQAFPVSTTPLPGLLGF